MAKNKTVFVCNNCGYESPKWMGKCPACNEWNSFFEEKVVNTKNSSSKSNKERTKPVSLNKIEGEKRRVPVNIEGSNFSLNTDYVVMAIGSHPNKKIIEKLNLKTNKWGYINVDENYKTSDEKIYAIGDIAGQKQTVAWAARSGFDCAKNILTNIKN